MTPGRGRGRKAGTSEVNVESGVKVTHSELTVGKMGLRRRPWKKVIFISR